jgi:hypothetical protein
MISRSLLASFKHVWDKDGALDTANPIYDHAEFVKTGDLKYVPVKEGERLTIFELAPLSRVQFQRVLGLRVQGDAIDAAALALAYGLRGVQNLHDENGNEVTVKRQTDDLGELRASKATLDAIYDMTLIAQLGTRIINESTLRPKNGQG